MAISDLWGQVGSYAGSPGAAAWKERARLLGEQTQIPFGRMARIQARNIALRGQRGQGVASIPETELLGQYAGAQAAGEQGLLGQAMQEQYGATQADLARQWEAQQRELERQYATKMARRARKRGIEEALIGGAMSLIPAMSQAKLAAAGTPAGGSSYRMGSKLDLMG